MKYFFDQFCLLFCLNKERLQLTHYMSLINKNLLNQDIKLKNIPSRIPLTFVEEEPSLNNDDEIFFSAYQNQSVKPEDEYISLIMASTAKGQVKFMNEFRNNSFQLNSKHREILVDWLITINDDFHFVDETIYNAISMLDRYSAVCQIPSDQIQLVGSTCLWIAAKLEEIATPTVEDFIFLCCDIYSKDQFYKCETIIVKNLGFTLTPTTPQTFYEGFMKRTSSRSPIFDELTTFFMISSIFLNDYGNVEPLLIAASCILLTKFILCVDFKFYEMNPELKKYQKGLIKQCAIKIAKMTLKQIQNENSIISRKYAQIIEENQIIQNLSNPNFPFLLSTNNF